MITDKNNRIIFKLLQLSLFSEIKSPKEDIDFGEDIDWNSILEELKAHTIETIPCEVVIQNQKIPEAIRQEWMNLTLSQVSRWTRLMAAQDELIELMRKNDIEIAIIKGSAAAILYPQPEYRAMGDIDFVVKGEKFAQACQIMIDNGYEFAFGEEKGKLHIEEDRFVHAEMKKNGIVFEIHKDFVKMLNCEKEGRLSVLVKEGLEHIEINKLQEYEVPMFNKELNGLVFLRHIIHHLGKKGHGLGLRQLLDWMMFVEKYVDDDYWKNDFEVIVTEAGLKTTAITFTRMCQMYLGLREENITWCMGADSELCEEWLKTIMGMGNFGRKREDKDLGVHFIVRNKNIFTFLKSLQARGEINWNLVGKRSVRKPFAWLYQIFLYFKKAFGRKSPIKTLKDDFSRSKKMKDMIDRLEIECATDIW